MEVKTNDLLQQEPLSIAERSEHMKIKLAFIQQLPKLNDKSEIIKKMAMQIIDLCQDHQLQGTLKLSPPILSKVKLATFGQVWAGQVVLTYRSCLSTQKAPVNPPSLALPLLYVSNHILLTGYRQSRSTGVPSNYL